jgi:hypothetical protein
VLGRLDTLGRLTFVARSDASGALVVGREDGAVFTRSRAIAAILGSLPLGGALGAVLLVPGVTWFADRAYDLVSQREAAISAWFGLEGLGAQRVEIDEPVFDDSAAKWFARLRARSREVAAMSFLIVCGIALARDMGDETVPSGGEGAIYRVVAYPRLFQRWGLFAPEPPKRLGALVAEGQTAGGTRLDPITGLASPARTGDARPEASGPRPQPLMAAYFTSISQPSRATYVNELREYVRRLGDRRGPSEKLVWFNVDWIEAPLPAPDPTDEKPEPVAVAPISRRITSGP